MAASILLATGLNESKLPFLIFFEENIGANASFLINCILSQRLKVPNNKIILCCCHQSFEHYHNAGLRLGYNLNTYKENKRITTIEPLEDISINYLSSKYLDRDSVQVFNHFKESITTTIRKFDFNSNIILIIDDISFLTNFGVNEQELVQFIKFLRELKNEFIELSLLLKINTSEAFEFFSNFMRDEADMTILIEKMKSGNFREVDGKLSIFKANDEKQLLRPNDVVKTILYKVTDKAVKIFAPGEVGIKI